MSTIRRASPIRLAFVALFWRLMIGLCVLFGFILWAALGRFVPPAERLVVFLFFFPWWAGAAFAIAAALTLIADVVVRLIVRPRLLAWASPRIDEGDALFHLGPREALIAETPARLARGRNWPAGRLVLTDRRLVFLPVAWDLEPWSTSFDRIRDCLPSEPPRLFWGLLKDVPPQLTIQFEGDEARRFAVPDARGWSRLVESRLDWVTFLPAGSP